jgi:hypothetical protein
MPPKHDKKLHARKLPAHVEAPGRSNRLFKLKEGHIRAAEAGHAPSHLGAMARLDGRGHPMKKPAEG